MTIDPNTGKISWIASGPSAPHYVTILADDGRGGHATQTYNSAHFWTRSWESKARSRSWTTQVTFTWEELFGDEKHKPKQEFTEKSQSLSQTNLSHRSRYGFHGWQGKRIPQIANEEGDPGFFH
jgi:hypothetical protein